MKRARGINSGVIYKPDETDEWFTPEWLRDLAHEVLGEITLDPCTHTFNPLRARHFYTKADDGLSRIWTTDLETARKPTLWMNHPFGLKPSPLWSRALERTAAAMPRLRALSLSPARPGTRWYRRASETSQLRCELDGRLTFELLAAGSRRKLIKADNPARWACVLFYYGPDRASVARALRPYGFVTLGAPSPVLPAMPDPKQKTIEQQIAEAS